MQPGENFSIIIPSYNRAGFVAKSIDSVLEQSFFKFELIIIDDGSEDNTAEVVNPYLQDNRIHYYKIENSERGAARNFGVSKSKGSYVTFLDSDDIFLPWHLEIARGQIVKHSRPAVFHLGYEMLHPDGRIDTLPKLPNPVNDKLLEGNHLSCMGVFLRRDVALANRFNEDRQLSGSEDYELWMRLAARYPIFTVPEVTSRLINHNSRSVVTTDTEKLMTRISLLDQTLLRDIPFVARFGDQLGIFTSYRSLYLALHLAMSGKRWLALKSLSLTARKYPQVIFSYRFVVALKKIILW
jgi:glycosyltransferase involved in cell wall biosynthesis